VSEELDELIEMARTIRMTPEEGIPCLERRETWGTRVSGYGNTQGPSTSLGMTGGWDDSQGGGGIGREVSGRSASCLIWRVCGA
jgi:hypothetical protein